MEGLIPLAEGGLGGKKKLMGGVVLRKESLLPEQPLPLNPPLLVRRGGDIEKRGIAPLKHPQ